MYSRKKIIIPTPYSIVFYNGVEQQEERKIMKLSDLYQVSEEDPMLELKVEMLNINDGNNEALKAGCKTLKEYMQYVNRVRYYIHVQELQLNAAVESAVTECIKNGILAEFLKKNRAEVVAMSIFEFDEEKEWKKYGKAEYQYGVEVGTKRGIEIGMQHGRQESLRVLIHSLRECSLELEEVYQKVKKQDIYRDVTFEVVKEIYISVQL